MIMDCFLGGMIGGAIVVLISMYFSRRAER